MGKLILYGIEVSPPVRCVLLTLEALELDFEFRIVDVFKSEHLQEDFLKKNPQHTVPLLEDDGQYIWDSHAIAAYLVRKYGKNDSLYPKDYYQRAVVDQRLHFDSGVLFPSVRAISIAVVFYGETELNQEMLDNIEKSYNFLEAFLQSNYIAGDHVTIADFCIASTLTCAEPFLPIDSAKTPKLVAWIKRLSELPYYDRIQSKATTAYAELVRSKLGTN